jgi:hypothetical protein
MYMKTKHVVSLFQMLPSLPQSYARKRIAPARTLSGVYKSYSYTYSMWQYLSSPPAGAVPTGEAGLVELEALS